MRCKPASANASAWRASSEPLVVSVMSSMPSRSLEHAHELGQVAAQQRLAAGQAQLAHAERAEDARQPGDLLEGEQLGPRQEREVAAVDLARHAVRAAEIAPVGDRDAQVVDRPAQRVDDGHVQRRSS